MRIPAKEPRVAIWGTFDIADFGDHLYPRIFECEMLRRLPAAHVTAFSPLGHLHPVVFDGGFMVEPLGVWSPERTVELAATSDLVAIGGGELVLISDDAYAGSYGVDVEEARRLRPSAYFIEGLGLKLEESHPVVWHSLGIPSDLDEETAERVRSALGTRAHASVRDEISRDWLLRAGVTREIAVVPDSVFLVDRVVSDDQIERRLDYLRGVGSYPATEPPLVVQGSSALLPHVEDIADALASVIAETGDVPVVLLETGSLRGDDEFAAAIAPYLHGDVYRMPESPIVEDIVAAIAYARGFAGSSLHGNEIAFARGLSSAVLDLGTGSSSLAGLAGLVRCEDALVRSSAELQPALRRVLSGTRPWDGLGEISSRIESHFDALAEIAERSASRGQETSSPARGTTATAARNGVRERETALQRAFEARGRRLVEQRFRLAAMIEELERELTDLRRQNEDRIEGLERELAASDDRIVKQRQEYEDEIERLREMLNASEGRVAALDSHGAEVEAEAERLSNEMHSLLASKSIRSTAPLRALVRLMRRMVS